jgi:hypothetical protein
VFLGLMAYLDPKGNGERSMPVKQRPCPGTRSGALRDPSDTVKARLPKSQSPEDANFSSVGNVPETGAVPCVRVSSYRTQPPWRGATPSEGV